MINNTFEQRHAVIWSFCCNFSNFYTDCTNVSLLMGRDSVSSNIVVFHTYGLRMFLCLTFPWTEYQISKIKRKYCVVVFLNWIYLVILPKKHINQTRPRRKVTPPTNSFISPPKPPYLVLIRIVSTWHC